MDNNITTAQMNYYNNNNNNNNNHTNSCLSLAINNGIVCEGWLTKSPPDKIWKTKWRRRWFVLRLPGNIPGQYVLEYYADSTKRKLKGLIDLDQCEQVDAGLQLENKKDNFQHMFDVKTAKRTYYLVANSESEMNKWVECICSVCGLRIHVEEGQDDRYSPQPSQELAFSANNNNNNTNNNTNSVSTNADSNGTLTTTIASSTPSIITCAPTSSTITSSNTLANNTLKNSENINNMKNHIKSNHAKSNSRDSTNTRTSVTHIDGPSGPYIPISECHTGKPVNGSLVDLDTVPQLPTKLSRTISDECYDIPRQLNPGTDMLSNKTEDSLLESVPKAPKSATNQNHVLRNTTVSTIPNPPKVNWSTYPRDSPEAMSLITNDSTRTSVRSCSAALDLTTRHRSKSGLDQQRSISPPNLDIIRDTVQSVDGNQQFQPPPRPPKPPSLRRSKSKSDGYGSVPNVAQLYDIPISGAEYNEEVANKRAPICPQSGDSPKSLDELYDFPRMNPRSSETTHFTDSTDKDASLINAPVPISTLDRSTSRHSKQHSYTNANLADMRPHYSVNKETIFNYDYKPTLTSGADENSNALANDSTHDRSPLTPNLANYCNSHISSSLPNNLVVGPPAVNRDLKPKRKGSDSDNSNTTLPSPTTKSATIQLQPPPALTRIQSAATKRSFRKPSAVQTQTTINGTLPRVPSRHMQQNHNREPSTSEDDTSLNGNSRLNSSNEEQTGKGTKVPPPPRHFEGSEIQYLDLDLESDTNSQSPRTPNEHNHQRSSSTLSNKELTTSASHNQSTSASSLDSTVYKTVDFLKTQEFNKLRLNMESFRNCQ
ncbi:GRB2-associated-binding protein 1-like [Oppia nitens]|uniref:GRB2-associated-binding protein 1-like n=1 Tax=Oppia nitens TaxID=1686743 RepID=UPI0023D9B9C8|nr:GRB2-associated-binding protein 1-like [Oppia nitens]